MAPATGRLVAGAKPPWPDRPSWSERTGSLVNRARVEMAAFAMGRMMRDTLLGLPPRLAPQLSAMTDAHEIEIMLRAALKPAIEGLSKAAEADLQKGIGKTPNAREPN